MMHLGVSDPFDRFVHAVHRRAVLLRVVEGAGLGVVGASVLVGVLTPVLLARNEPAMVFASVGLMVGAMLGALRAALCLPSVKTTLQAVDDQLHLHDLLGTAYTLQHDPAVDPQGAAVVLSHARRHCATLSPSEVTLNRYGPRGWGAIGLVALLVLTVSMTSTSPSARATGNPDPLLDAWLVDTNPSAQQAVDQVGRRAPVLVARPGEPDMESKSDTAPDSQGATGTPREGARPMPGTGAGETRTDDDLTMLPPAPPRGDTRVARDGVFPGNTGGSRTSPNAPSSSPFTPGRARDTTRTPHIAPWETRAWSYAQTQAMEALRAERVPDPYRNIVRDYFEREGSER